MADRYAEDPGVQGNLDRLTGSLLDRVLDASEQDAKRYVPVLTGYLRNHIGTRKLTPTHGQLYADAEYAAAVENGHTNHRSGKRIPAQPYLRPAVYKNRNGS